MRIGFAGGDALLRLPDDVQRRGGGVGRQRVVIGVYDMQPCRMVGAAGHRQAAQALERRDAARGLLAVDAVGREGGNARLGAGKQREHGLQAENGRADEELFLIHTAPSPSCAPVSSGCPGNWTKRVVSA